MFFQENLLIFAFNEIETRKAHTNTLAWGRDVTPRVVRYLEYHGFKRKGNLFYKIDGEESGGGGGGGGALHLRGKCLVKACAVEARKDGALYPDCCGRWRWPPDMHRRGTI